MVHLILVIKGGFRPLGYDRASSCLVAVRSSLEEFPWPSSLEAPMGTCACFQVVPFLLFGC